MRAFRACSTRIDALGLKVVLVSADPPAALAKLLRSMQLPFIAVSDVDHSVADRYGVDVSRKHP